MFEIHIILLFFLIVSFLDWHKGLFICIGVGFIQDPIRKLMVGHSVYYTTLIVPFIMATLLGLLQYRKNLRINFLFVLYPKLKMILVIFLLIVIAQAMHTLITTQSIITMGIGLVSYIGPLMGVILAFNYAQEKKDIEGFLSFYLILGAVFMAGVLLEAMGVQSALLGSVGGKHLYTFAPFRITLLSGFMRAAEISAWHGAMIAMLSVIMFSLTKYSGWQKYIWLVVAATALFAVVFTGRRKGLYVFSIFIVIAIILAFYSYSKSWIKYFSFVILGCVFIVLSWQLISFKSQFINFDAYAERMVSKYSDETFVDRFMATTVSSLKWVVLHNGIMGSGAGTGSQGVQHFGGMRTGLAAEGGVAKVLAELGIPGLAIAIWLFSIVMYYIWKIVTYVTHDKTYESLAIGLSAILIAYSTDFAVAHQAFGDPFIMLLIGLIIGFTMAIPSICESNDINRWIKHSYTIPPIITDSKKDQFNGVLP